MFVEPLQELGILSRDLPADTWEDEARRDAVWLSAGELWLRRTFLDGGGGITQLTPTPDDVRVAGASFGCSLFLGCPRSAGQQQTSPADVFLFTGDLLKWRTEFGDRLGEPSEYLNLTQRLAAACVARWEIYADQDRYARLQALIWSVQTLRVRPASVADLATPITSQVERILGELGLEHGPEQPRPFALG